MSSHRVAGAVRLSVALAVCAAASVTVLAQSASVGQARPDMHAGASADPFVDPLDAPALQHRNVAGRPLMAVARAGGRLVAVGQRGLIAVSENEGKDWRQVGSPVSSDLLALSFPNANDGWAVGHDGVVLHTADGGRTWLRQFDGRSAATALTDFYRQRIAAGDTSLQPYLDQLALDYKNGPSLPLLSVWFENALHGIAVGPFGMAVSTDDGGKSWLPMLDRIDNPDFLHLNAISAVDGDVYIAGEKGTMFRRGPHDTVFRRVQTGYAGSFFGVTGGDGIVLAYGLRGTVYRSGDHGANWTPLKSPMNGMVTTAASVASHRTFLFATATGEVARYDASSGAFHLLGLPRTTPVTGLLALGGEAFAVCGLGGVYLARFE
jgi:photosystem II stability/assembly factor-like uncharacterized protein